VPDSDWFPDPGAWSNPCLECERNVLCSTDGVCKRCYTHTWPPVEDEAPPLTVAPRVRGLPKCLQCFKTQADAPGDTCKHPAWHDLPRPELEAEHTQLADAV
jgi:hypothetical protein